MVIGLLGAGGERRFFMHGSQVGKLGREAGLMEVRRRRVGRRQDVSNGDVVIGLVNRARILRNSLCCLTQI